MDRVTFEDVLSVAKAEIGYTETPANSNRTKYGAWFGLNGQPWCMMFIMWCFSQAGGYEMPPIHTASCGSLMRAAKSKGQWITGDYHPGDVVIFDFPNTQYKTDHCGIVWQVLENEVLTIEGNTSDSCAAHEYAVNYACIYGYGTPQYPSSKSTVTASGLVRSGYVISRISSSNAWL